MADALGYESEFFTIAKTLNPIIGNKWPEAIIELLITFW